MMKTSARNHLTGTVIHIEAGTVDDEVTVMLDGSGMHIFALVSRARVELMKLQVGSRVMVLIKTHDVILITDFGGVQFSARNQLPGAVVSMTESLVSADVRIRLDGGGIISAVVTMESVRELDLEPGSAVTVMVRASNVIIGAMREGA